LPWRFHSAVVVSTPHPSDCLSPRDACERRDRCQSCSGPADAAAACEFDALGRGALVGLCECGDRAVCRCRCAEIGPPHPSVIPVEGSGIVRQEVDAELGLEAVGQRVSQSATADSAAAGELYDVRTIGPPDHDRMVGAGVLDHGRQRATPTPEPLATATAASPLDVPLAAG
jgi:hypothetical protein